MHKNRTWCVHPIAWAEDLAETLVDHTWVSCAGWQLGNYLFLNDQTCEDGAFEVAIVKIPTGEGQPWWQVETVTFGWFTSPALLWQEFRETGRRWTPTGLALRYFHDALGGKFDPDRPDGVAWRIDPPHIEDPAAHGRCPLCA
jgi:hypothetical protein